MSYSLGQFAPMSQPSGGGGIPMAVVGVAAVGVLGLIGFMVYQQAKVRRQIIEKHGVGAALGYDAGMTALSMLNRNGKRRRRSSRRRR